MSAAHSRQVNGANRTKLQEAAPLEVYTATATRQYPMLSALLQVMMCSDACDFLVTWHVHASSRHFYKAYMVLQAMHALNGRRCVEKSPVQQTPLCSCVAAGDGSP
jgi:hypothetical protein